MSAFLSRRERKTIVDPSGDHFAFKSGNWLKVSWVAPEPSALITQISPRGPRPPRVHTIFDPSGDQEGKRSSILSSVILCWPDPSGFITQRSTWPPRSLSKTIRPWVSPADAGEASSAPTRQATADIPTNLPMASPFVRDQIIAHGVRPGKVTRGAPSLRAGQGPLALAGRMAGWIRSGGSDGGRGGPMPRRS